VLPLSFPTGRQCFTVFRQCFIIRKRYFKKVVFVFSLVLSKSHKIHFLVKNN
jgi:hypothetical protein